MTRVGRMERIYFFWTKYYTINNNSEKALLYLDSAAKEQQKNSDMFNATKLLRIEQRTFLQKQEAKDKEIALTKKR